MFNGNGNMTPPEMNDQGERPEMPSEGERPAMENNMTSPEMNNENREASNSSFNNVDTSNLNTVFSISSISNYFNGIAIYSE